MPAASPSPSVVGLIVFVCLLLAALAAGPLLAWGLRRALPPARREKVEVEPVCFGTSERPRRAPRHAVLLHRALLTTALLVPLACLLVPCVVALRQVGLGGLQTAVVLALPTLLVTLHARRRSLGS